jgi:hypothetical protein
MDITGGYGYVKADMIIEKTVNQKLHIDYMVKFVRGEKFTYISLFTSHADYNILLLNQLLLEL